MVIAGQPKEMTFSSSRDNSCRSMNIHMLVSIGYLVKISRNSQLSKLVTWYARVCHMTCQGWSHDVPGVVTWHARVCHMTWQGWSHDMPGFVTWRPRGGHMTCQGWSLWTTIHLIFIVLMFSLSGPTQLDVAWSTCGERVWEQAQYHKSLKIPLDRQHTINSATLLRDGE